MSAKASFTDFKVFKFNEEEEKKRMEEERQREHNNRVYQALRQLVR